MVGRVIEVQTKTHETSWANAEHVVAIWAGAEDPTVVALVGGHEQVRVKKRAVRGAARLDR